MKQPKPRPAPTAPPLYVEDVARRLGKSEAAIRSAVQRGAPWLPKPHRIGRKLAWKPDAIDAIVTGQAT